MVLEALSKYLLAYDFGGVSINEGRKIRVQSYCRTTWKAATDFRFSIAPR